MNDAQMAGKVEQLHQELMELQQTTSNYKFVSTFKELVLKLNKIK